MPSLSRISAEERAAFVSGFKAIVPVLLGITPWAIVTGVAMVAAGLSRAEALAMSFTVFAGSAQLAVLALLVAKAPLWVMLLTTLVVNLRFVIYGATLAPHFSHLPRLWRWSIAYILTDGVFALCTSRFASNEGVTHKHWFYAGASANMWLTWQGFSVLGIVVGGGIPAAWSLDFAGTLALTALLVPLLFDRAVVLAAITAAGVAVLAHGLPMRLGLVAAIVCGVTAGMVAERAWRGSGLGVTTTSNKES